MEKESLRALRENFGARCRELRVATGLSQEAFARRAEIDRTYYTSIELGARNVTIGTVAKIADALGVTMSDLLDGVSPERQ